MSDHCISMMMEVNYPRPTYAATAPARPRLHIPTSISSLPSKSLSAPANHTEKLLITPASTLKTATNLSPNAMPEPAIHCVYNSFTRSWTYLVADPVTEQAIVIDPVLDYDHATTVISTKSADKLLDVILTEGYTIGFILETRLHRTHISAAAYLQRRLNDLSTTKAKICMGTSLAQHRAANRLSKDLSSKQDDGYFDHLFSDYEQFRIGNIVADVVQLPFNTSTECVGYIIGINVFTTIPINDSSNSTSKSPSNDGTVGSPASTQTTVPIDQLDTSDGWRRLMNLPTLCRVYGGTERAPSQPWLTYEEMRALHDRVGAEPETPMNGERNEVLMQFYATQINVRAGNIPAKINMTPGEDGKADREMAPLKIPKKLASLLC